MDTAGLRDSLVAALAGRYAIDQDLLGRGGMALVYGARDLRHGRRVAVKVLHPEQAAVFGADRFLREINLTAGLQHPHILPLLDSGSIVFEGSQVPYYVMPLVIGQSLKAKLDIEGRLSVAEALVIARDVAEGLQYAHDRGVVHRDIKPENILLNESGAALIADFGVALGGPSEAVRLTETGTTVGTPTHMSPEQLFGSGAVDARSDQWSLAATVFEMLAGRPPYDAPTRTALIAQRLSAPPGSVRAARPELSAGYEPALARGLDRDPAKRFPSVSGFLEALVAANAPPPPRRGGRGLQVLASALAVAAVAFGAMWFTNRPVRTVKDGAMVVLADVENLTSDSTLGPTLRVAAVVGLQQSSAFSLYPRTRLGSSLARMGRTITDTVLSEGLAREIAVREAGQVVIVLSVAEIGGRFTIGSRLVDPVSGEDLATHQSRAEESAGLLDALDGIVTWTRRRLGDAAVSRAQPLPLVTTSSLQALRAYADGRAAFRRSDWPAVARMLTRAIELDTGFAMAQALLGEYHVFNNRIPEGLRWLREADRRSGRLTEVEQLNVKSRVARAEGRTGDEISLAQTLATNFPSAMTWQVYGEALRAARRYPEAIAALEKAVALDSVDPGGWYNLALAHRALGNYRIALDAFAQVDRVDSTFLVSGFYNQFWGSTLVSIDSLSGAEAVFRRMLARPARADQARGYRSLAYLSLYRGRFADAVAELHRAIPLQTRGTLSEYRDLLLLADAELTRGNPGAARVALARAFAIFRTAEIGAGAVMFGGHQFIRAGQLDRGRLLLDTLRARAALRPASTQDQEALAVLTADIALAERRPDRAREAVGSRQFDDFEALGLSLAAEMFAGLGQLDSALIKARAASDSRAFGFEMQQDWFRSFSQLARLAEAKGDTATAIEAYSKLIARWGDGDPDLPPLVAAKRELSRLQSAARR